VRPAYTGPPREAVPDLEPAAGDSTGPAAPPKAPRAMCLMTNRAWLLVRVAAWAPFGDRWAVLLEWHIAGRRREGWFVHDGERLLPVGGDGEFPDLIRPRASLHAGRAGQPLVQSLCGSRYAG
jgi:hypothetical protein